MRMPDAWLTYAASGLLSCAMVVVPASVRAESSPELSAAIQPLVDGVPEVAVVRLRELLQRDLAKPHRMEAMVKLGESLIAAGQPAEALAALHDPSNAKAGGVDFLQAQAHAALGRWAEALSFYRQVAGEANSPLQDEALFGQAEALRALGKTAEALQTLAPLRRNQQWSVQARLRSTDLLLDRGDPAAASRMLRSVQPQSATLRKYRRFLYGRIALAQNNRPRAVELFSSILKAPQGATHSVLIATLIGIADAHLQSKTPAAGDNFLEEYIEHHPADAALPRLFAKLDQLYAAERNQSRHELGRWSNEEAQPRRSLALWYLARAELRMGHRELALDVFEQLRASHAPREILAEASLEHASLRASSGQFDGALAVLDAVRALDPPALLLDRINFLAGDIQSRANRFDSAARAFQQASHSSSLFAADALYNVSLSWLQAGETQQFATSRQAVAQSEKPEAAADLLLEQALVQASRKDAHAADSLQKFVRDFPQHSRAAEAWVALAELAFHSAPPRIEEAQRHLARAAESRPDEPVTERADYLRIWMEEASPPKDDAKVIAMAKEFVQRHPSSPRLADVRLKLAETYFRRQDFPGAQTEFELLAQRNPDSPEAEKAQFFAAQAAMQSMGANSLDRALMLFDAVVKRDGELKWAARNEQAVIERKLGKPQDAITLYNEVIRGAAKLGEKREALCGKADVLYELGTADRENYRRAAELYEELGAQKEISPHWRNQALFKKGMCLEKLEAPAEALATFYKIVEDESRPGRRREFFWFYKAGFNAARLLEEDNKWQPAAAIYEKLAFAGGARTEEAKSRLNRIRLEHFLWEE